MDPSPRWIPVSPSTLTITPPPENFTPPPLITPGLSFTPVIPPGPFSPTANSTPQNPRLVRDQALRSIYERLLLSDDMRERVHRTIGILWNEENMTLVTHRVMQGGNSAMFDFLEMFQNITNIENHTPGIQQVQDHLMVDLVLRLLEQGIKHEIYCTATWGGDPDPIFHNTEAQYRAGVNRPFHASIYNRPPPTPRLWVGPRQQQRMTQLLTRSAVTNRDMANQNQALRNLLRDLETPREMPLDWAESAFLDNIIQTQGQAAAPSSITTIPPFDSLNPTAPPFVPARSPTPYLSRRSRQPLSEISSNRPQDLSLCRQTRSKTSKTTKRHCSTTHHSPPFSPSNPRPPDCS